MVAAITTEPGQSGRIHDATFSGKARAWQISTTTRKHMNAILKPVPTESLDDLIAAWRGCKAAETAYNKDRLAIEAKILAIVGTDTTGSMQIDGLTIQFGMDRKWDQDRLAELQPKIMPEFWPFKTEFREDRKAARLVEERFPDLWAELQHALTTKPRKPCFAIKE